MVNILNIDSQGPNDSENVKKVEKKSARHTFITNYKKRKQISSDP